MAGIRLQSPRSTHRRRWGMGTGGEMCPAGVTAVAGPGPIRTVPSASELPSRGAPFLELTAPSLQAGSPAAQGSLVRVTDSPPENTRFLRVGAGQRAEAAALRAGKRIQFREGPEVWTVWMQRQCLCHLDLEVPKAKLPEFSKRNKTPCSGTSHSNKQ